MGNKEIQETRMKGYFIQAAKEILRGEGIKCASVRNISEKAGYSYSTMYNYFKDVNDLIFLCVSDFQEECKQYATTKIKKDTVGTAKIKAMALAYIDYFVEYPGIFDLFYLTKMSDFGNKQSTIDVISNSLNDICETDWDYCAKNGILASDKIEDQKSQLQYCVIGLLLLYLNRRTPDSYLEFIKLANRKINHVLGA